jgi:ribonuclease VapC
MIIDTSAILAILLHEPGHEALVVKVGGAAVVGVGAPTLAEASAVLTSRLGPSGLSMLGRLIQESGATVVPFGATHWQIAVDAFNRFGKGRHPAALNFGDCLTYAIARAARQPLLAVGDDFTRTDLDMA